MRLAFLGTPDFALPTLRALHQAGHEIAAVYTQPPRPAGRGQALRKSPIHLYAEQHGLPVFTPRRLKRADNVAQWRALNLDCAIVVAFGQILSKDILDAPRLGCINVHASLLPRWRGAAPLHRAIMAGDRQTGLSIMRMDEGLDTGPVLMRETHAIAPDDTTQSLHDALAEKAGPLLLKALDGVAKGRLEAIPQAEEGICYAHKIDKSESMINWDDSAIAIDRKIRGLTPFPGAFTLLNGERLKILKAEIVSPTDPSLKAPPKAPPGTALDDALTIACGQGALKLIHLQKPGRGAMDAASFLRGHAIPKGTRFGPAIAAPTKTMHPGDE
ncbi:methionyl-tRNA formyltransferase [Iodidimonas sp. MBR-22]|uniref:methionyl-tRNA formyltransferase n=1 Tax=unclassified Iodidimonas TaxID=2626145 RepID=UPI0032B2FC13